MSVLVFPASREMSLPASAAELPRFDERQIQEHAADAHLCALGLHGEIRARCSLWWNETPPLAEHRVGAVGHFASADDESSADIIEKAADVLRGHGCTLAVAPMDGNTWRRYRFVTDCGPGDPAEPPFFLEPTNPPEWPRQFERGGFTKLAEYYSAVNSNLGRPDERMAPIAARLEGMGISIRTARGMNLHEQLKRIYQVSRIAFARNFLYTELPEAAFIGQYLPLLDRMEPDLLFLAEQGSDLVGYLFAIPDFAQAARGRTIDTFLIKTVAILPETRLRGLGGLLVARAHEAGYKSGFRRAIHALMHEDNVSRNISNHYATTVRRYTLYSRELPR